MITYSAAVLAAFASGRLGVVQLVHMAFATPVALNTSNWNLTFGNVVYRGAYGLGTISNIKDAPGEVNGITLSLFGDNTAMSLALDEGNVVPQTPLTIRTAVIELDTYTVLDAPVVWAGKLDTMNITEDGQSCTITVTAESIGVDLLRGSPSYYADSDQRLIDPNDGSFMYVVDQVGKPLVWPAKSFFQQ